jgi:hypothetical protein
MGHASATRLRQDCTTGRIRRSGQMMLSVHSAWSFGWPGIAASKGDGGSVCLFIGFGDRHFVPPHAPTDWRFGIPSDFHPSTLSIAVKSTFNSQNPVTFHYITFISKHSPHRTFRSQRSCYSDVQSLQSFQSVAIKSPIPIPSPPYPYRNPI